MTNDCIEWWGARLNSGYGTARHHGHSRLKTTAHRVIYEACFGAIPDGLIVRHKCDNKTCVNPDHLEVGTHKDNERDKWERGRAPSSSRLRSFTMKRWADPAQRRAQSLVAKRVNKQRWG